MEGSATVDPPATQRFERTARRQPDARRCWEVGTPSPPGLALRHGLTDSARRWRFTSLMHQRPRDGQEVA